MGNNINKQWLRASLASKAWALALLASASTTLAQTPNAETGVESISIAAGPLGDALFEIVNAYGVNIIGSEELVEGKSSPSIEGAMTAEDALNRALLGAGLVANRSEAGAFIIARNSAPASSLTEDNKSAARTEEPHVVDNIVVVGTSGSYPLGVGKKATVGVLGERDLVGTPISIKRFEEQFLRDVQAVRLGDFATRDASFTQFSPPSDSARSLGVIRGFRVNPGDYSWNGFLPLLDQDPPVEIVETLDILKGPTALVTGVRPFNSTGGTINISTKSPAAEPITRLSARWIGDGLFGVHSDVSRRMGDSEQFGIRTNIAYRDGEPLKNNQDEESLVLHAALDYQGEKLRINFDGLYREFFLSGRNDGAIFYWPGVDILDPIPDYERLAAPDWTYVDFSTRNVQLRAEYDLTDSIEFFGAYMYGEEDFEPKAMQVFLLDADGNADVSGFFFSSRTELRGFDSGLRWTAESASFGNVLTVTASRFEHKNGFTNFLRGVDLTGGQTVNVYDFDSLISVPGFDSGFDRAADIPFSRIREGISAAIINQTVLFDGQFDVIVGGRWTRFEDENQAGATTYKGDDFSPSFGLVFKPVENASVYASYMQALEPGQAAPPGAVNFGESTAPARSESYELGAKVDFGRFGATAAIFEITKPSAFNDPDTLIFDLFGEDRHRGVEADVFGEAAAGVRIYGSVTYLDAEVVNNVNPAIEGNQPINVPEWSAAAGFDVDIGFIPNASVTGALRYSSERFLDTTNERSIDGATTIDVGLRYGFIVDGVDMVARLNVTNVFDEEYYAGAQSITSPGETRNFLVSLTASF